MNVRSTRKRDEIFLDVTVKRFLQAKFRSHVFFQKVTGPYQRNSYSGDNRSLDSVDGWQLEHVNDNYKVADKNTHVHSRPTTQPCY
jgi:hypothetical protein